MTRYILRYADRDKVYPRTWFFWSLSK